MFWFNNFFIFIGVILIFSLNFLNLVQMITVQPAEVIDLSKIGIVMRLVQLVKINYYLSN